MCPHRPTSPARPRRGRPRPSPPELAVLARLSLLASALGLVLLALLGLSGPLPPPPLHLGSIRSSTAWSDWFDRVGAPGALMSGVRLAAIALAGYLLLLVVVEV